MGPDPDFGHLWLYWHLSLLLIFKTFESYLYIFHFTLKQMFVPGDGDPGGHAWRQQLHKYLIFFFLTSPDSRLQHHHHHHRYIGFFGFFVSALPRHRRVDTGLLMFHNFSECRPVDDETSHVSADPRGQSRWTGMWQRFLLKQNLFTWRKKLRWRVSSRRSILLFRIFKKKYSWFFAFEKHFIFIVFSH